MGTVTVSILFFWYTPQITDHITSGKEVYYTCTVNANLLGAVAVSILFFGVLHRLQTI
jgi:hypothetical protein